MSGNIILTGFSGTGKSSVGRAVAELQGWVYWDTDEEIVSVTGKSVAEIFEEDGEEAFRYLEKEAVALACEEANVVVATGGGAIIDPDNYAAMAASGVIVCLEATPETIVARLSATPEGDDAPEERPLLAVPDPIERVRELKAERQENYDMAAFSVQTDGLSVDEAAREVARLWRERMEPDHE